MNAKFSVLVTSKMWELVPISQEMNIIGHKWVFKTKLNVNGTL